MSDETEMNGTEPTVPAGAPVVVAPKASSGDFLSTTAGKSVLIVGAVVVLLVIAGVVGWFVLGPASMGGTGTPAAPTAVVPSPAVPAPSAPASSSVVPTLPPADITSRDVFTPRNPFTVIKPAVIATSTTSTNNNSSNNSNNSGTTDDSNTLSLTSITTVDGVPKAVVKLGSVSYTVGEGDVIGSSDYKVQSIGTSSIDVLYGDDLFTISETGK